MRKNRDFGEVNCIGMCNAERGAAGHTALLYREVQSGGRGVCLKVRGTFDALFSRRVGAGQGGTPRTQQILEKCQNLSLRLVD